MNSKSFSHATAATIVLVCVAQNLSATVVSGPGGSGVTAGSSSLFSVVDLSDTFTGTTDGGLAGRPYVSVVQPAVVEYTDGNAARAWTSSFSFAQDPSAGGAGFVDGTPVYPGNSMAGPATGFTQTGGAVDYGTVYGLRNRFVAQFDGVQMTERMDVTVSGTQGGIADAAGVSVFFRASGGANPEIGIYRAGVGETNSLLTSGIVGNTWNNYAVAFDRIDNEIEIFVNEVSRGSIDLNTFAGGSYADFSSAAVNFGGRGGNRLWTDNAQVGYDPVGPESLVAYVSFDESAAGTGTAFDRAFANNGVFAGTATRTSGIIGTGAADFNGTNGDGVDIGTGILGLDNKFAFTTGITVEAMILPDGALGSNLNEEIYRKEDGNDRVLFSFQDNGSILSFGLNTGGYSELDMPLDGLAGRPTLADLKDGNPHHLVATYDAASGEKFIFIDGLEVFSAAFTPGTLITSGGNAAGVIGAHGGAEPFNGVIDEFALYNAALSAEVILHHYQRTLVGQSYFVPEPQTYGMFLIGTVSLVFLGVHRRNRA